MSYLILIVAVVIIIVSVVVQERDKWSKKQPQLAKYTYRRKQFFMSKPEHEFFDVLVEVIGSDYNIFPQVHLSTILDHKVKGQNRGAFNHINSWSVDFVICDKAYINPLLAIELDDSSHGRQDRQTRDEEVERIFRDAGMPLLRFPYSKSPDKNDIASRLAEALHISTKMNQKPS